MAGMGYFRDRIALLDKGSQEFLTVLVAIGGYCTVSQAEALKIVKSTRARARLRALERLGFLRRVAAYPVVYQVTKSTTRLLQRDSSNRRRHRLATVQARLLLVAAEDTEALRMIRWRLRRSHWPALPRRLLFLRYGRSGTMYWVPE